MWISHRKEIRKLTFRALALRRSEFQFSDDLIQFSDDPDDLFWRLSNCVCAKTWNPGFKRHSLSNHFLFEADWIRLRFLTDFIFKQCFAVAIRMCSTFSRESLTFMVGSFSFRNSLISICVREDRSTSLTFCVESFSHQTCFGRRFKVLFAGATFVLQVFASMFSQVITGLWSEKYDGSLTTTCATDGNKSWYILRNQRRLFRYAHETWLVLMNHR